MGRFYVWKVKKELKSKALYSSETVECSNYSEEIVQRFQTMNLFSLPSTANFSYGKRPYGHVQSGTAHLQGLPDM